MAHLAPGEADQMADYNLPVGPTARASGGMRCASARREVLMLCPFLAISGTMYPRTLLAVCSSMVKE